MADETSPSAVVETPRSVQPQRRTRDDSPVDRELLRLRIHEQQIGCENCHGPGSLHIAFRNGDGDPPGDVDYTIVNPARLSRELNEAICANCHLLGAGVAFVRGRSIEDFRPGLPLTDFRMDYRLDLPQTAMTVTGHFEQLHRSKCYTQSTTMTCTTCHDPHKKPESGKEVEYYRAKCLACHDQGRGCGLTPAQRLATSPRDDCTLCHMQRTKVQIPHLVFTHHRIGLEHTTKYEAPQADGAHLVPIFPPSPQLSQLDRDRCLAIANSAYSQGLVGGESQLFRQRAHKQFAKTYAAGLRDPMLLESMAWLYWELRSDKAVELAEAALNAEDCPPESRVNALYLLAEVHLQRGESARASEYLERLTQLRLEVNDWKLLGSNRLERRDFVGARAAYHKAVAIHPQDPNSQRALAEAYEMTGELQLAERHRKIAVRLESRFDRTP